MSAPSSPHGAASPTRAFPPLLLLTLKEAAERLAVSPRTVERLIRNGDLKLYRVGVGGPRRFRLDDVDHLLVAEQSRSKRDDNINDFITQIVGR